MTVRNRIRELGIEKRSPSDARMKYPKQDFIENSLERAYILGFRLGDLNSYKTKKSSDLIVIRCHTTQLVQVKLMEQLFSPYGHVSITKSIYGYTVNCFLNKTFAFLLPKHKKAPLYVRKSIARAWAFTAGYVDAEGYFGLNQSKARFKIDSYDVEILNWIVKTCQRDGVHVIFRQIARRGQPQSRIGIFHKDLWRLEINEARSILRFIQLVGPFIRHEKRKTDMIICQHNIENRYKKGSIT